MQQIYALRIATKDRPPVFQRIVVSLFSVALLTVGFCLFQQANTKPAAAAPSQTSQAPVKKSTEITQFSFAGASQK